MTRIPALERACNFRDFGGYPTRDGRRLRRDQLYRSGVMSQLSEADRRTVARFGLRLVCDLRRPDERASQPNPEFGPDVRSIAWDTSEEGAFLKALPDPRSIDPGRAHKLMARHYAGMPARLTPHLRGMFHELARGAGIPMIVHCTAGKDRTGFAVAMLLSALDVPRDAIFDDYLLTNSAVDLRARLLDDDSGFGVAPSTRFMVELRPAAQDALLSAHADYLQSAFDAVESTHGSVEAYLRDAIGCDAAMRDRIEQAVLI
jgi:protein-tyrosine phosphatase